MATKVIGDRMRPVERLAQSEHASECEDAEVEARSRYEAAENGKMRHVECPDTVLGALRAAC